MKIDNKVLYFDEAATSRPSEEALENFTLISRECWYNPSAVVYNGGMNAHEVLEKSREQIAELVNAEPEQIFFTSGSTEAANWVIQANRPTWSDVILCSPIEHPCVYNTALNTKELGGVHVGILDVNRKTFKIDFDYRNCYIPLAYSVRDVMVCACMADSETGTIQDIDKLTSSFQVKNLGWRTLCDMTQAFAHGIDFDVSGVGVDFAFGSGQKFGAFKGTGFLYVKDPYNLRPLMYGGHQERRRRPGTENVAAIYAMSNALWRTKESSKDRWVSNNIARQHFVASLRDIATVNCGYPVLPNIISMTLRGIDANKLISFLNMEGIYLSAGSACSTGENMPSRILKAFGLSDEEARSTIRISFGDDTRDSLEYLSERIRYHVKEGLCKLE